MFREGLGEQEPPREKFTLQVGAGTEIGEKHREEGKTDQDTVLVNNEKQIYGEFDGMGGHAAGEKASKMAATIIEERILQSLKDINLEGFTPEEAGKILKLSFLEADKKIVRGGTTGTVIMFVREKAVFAHVGDSRLDLVRKGNLERLTRDDTLFGANHQDPQEARQLSELVNFKDPNELTEEEKLDRWHQSVLMQSLGIGGEVRPQVGIIDVREGDIFVISSDGVHRKIKENRELEILSSASSSEAAAENLIREAKENGSGDDCSAVVISLEKAV